MIHIIKDQPFSFRPDMGAPELVAYLEQIEHAASFNGQDARDYYRNGTRYLLTFTFAGGQLNSLRGRDNVMKPAWVMTNYPETPATPEIVFARAWAKAGQVLAIEEYNVFEQHTGRATWDPKSGPSGFRKVRVSTMSPKRA